MIKSMTGYGQATAEGHDFKVRVEIRSVNNRYLDVHMRLPQELASLELLLKKRIQEVVKRGRVDVNMSIEQLKQAHYEINRPLVSGYLTALAEMKAEFGLEGNPSLELIAKLPGALQVSQDTGGLDEALVKGIEDALSQAMVAHNSMRQTEGQELASEINSRLDTIERELTPVEEEAGKLPALYREKLLKRIGELAGSQLDETRIAQEAIILADRSDISEEIARLKSHIIQMREVLQSEQEAGKRFDFILQEMNREANTILSKANEIEICDPAIVIKTEVEKLREQVQNVE